jgi:2-desacetyl-2-hydroxyethyl bacteriochlorophyllide A dehydrogenase
VPSGPSARRSIRAVEWRGPEALALVDREAPEAAAGQAVVAVAHCGICGSDLHSYRDGLAATPGQVLGHEFSGTVLEAPDVEGLAPGDRVAVRPLIPCGRCRRCRAGEPNLCEAGAGDNIGYGSPGAFAERVLVPRAALGETVFRLPAEVGDRAGALVEPLAVALHAVRVGAVGPEDVVLVLGAGMIGLGVTRLLRLAGVGRLVVADLSPLRRERALALGADRTIDPRAEDVTKAMREITGPGGFGLGAAVDVVFECAGVEETLAHALKSARQGGTLVLTAVYAGAVTIHPDRIVEKELAVRGAFAYRDEFPAVIELLASGAVDPDEFVSHSFGLDDVELAFRTQMDTARSIKVLVTPR